MSTVGQRHAALGAHAARVSDPAARRIPPNPTHFNVSGQTMAASEIEPTGQDSCIRGGPHAAGVLNRAARRVPPNPTHFNVSGQSGSVGGKSEVDDVFGGPPKTARRRGALPTGERARALVQLAAWAPMALVVGLIIGVELARLSGGFGTGLTEGPAWIQWLLMSGNGFLLSWTLFFQQAEARTRTRSAESPGTGAVPGIGAVIILSLVMVQSGGSDELMALMIVLFGPTLLIGYSLVGWGLPRLKRLSQVAAVLAGLALVNFLCQLGYAPVGFGEDVRVFTFTSLFLGTAIGVRLAIWWLTDEGYVSAQSV